MQLLLSFKALDWEIQKDHRKPPIWLLNQSAFHCIKKGRSKY